jgi:predicted regulator of Ras-like GTPase activity (Roadblock/LC7/MglB family)
MMTNPFCWFDPSELASLAQAAASDAPISEKNVEPPFASSETALHRRCSAYLLWVTRRVANVHSVFLTGADGLPIMGTEAEQTVVAAAASLMSSVFGVNSNLQMQIDHLSASIQAGKVLQLVFLRSSSIGAVAVGLVTVKALSEEEKFDLRAGLQELARTIEKPQTGDTHD